MKKLLLVLICALSLFANENINMKNCEKVQLSKYTTLVSCHQVDYIIEYKFVDDEEKDNIKKITAVTTKDHKIVLSK